MDVQACFLVFSGDLAFSGKPEEYVLVREFVTNIRQRLNACRKGLEIHLLAIPGNHDCDFSRANQVRELILRNLDVEALKDASIVGSCTEVQQPFFEFLRAVDPSLATSFQDPLCDTRDFKVDGATIRFTLLNSAWCSSLQEQQGSLRFPPGRIQPANSEDSAPDAAITVTHHPFNWLAADNARSVRES